MAEIPMDAEDPSLFPSTDEYGVRKAAGHLRRSLRAAADALETGNEDGSARRAVESAAVFYRDALFSGRDGRDGLPDLTALQEWGRELAVAAESESAYHLFEAAGWTPAAASESHHEA
ncbi:MAG TPA: hypothetical protein VIF43_00175 [Patescibacteria group bacterium]|jgi:hypothetical protein